MINKNNLIKIFIIFFIAVICLSIYNECRAIDTDIMSNTFTDQFNPKNSGDDAISRKFTALTVLIVNRILGILQIIGAVLLAVSIAIAGLNGILGAGGDVAEDLDLTVGESYNKYGNRVTGVKTLSKAALTMIIRRISIGSIILFGSATIVKIVFKMISGL